MVHNEPMRTTTPTPNVRLTISVTPEVHETFQRLAKASSMSTGRAMGDWLNDTLEGAQFMAVNMERARAAPRLVAQELHAYALGMTDEMGDVLKKLREQGTEDRAGGALAPPLRHPTPSPPSSNTGGKVPKKVHKNGRGVS